MKGVFWQNGQRIIRQVLDWFSASKDEIDQEFRQDYTQAGVVTDVLNEFEITVGDNNAPPTTHSININTGTAYDSLGQRVSISDATESYDATNPSDTTDDGLGNFVSTPHSTGSKNVPLTANSFNYIWLDYLLVTDESVFTLQRATNAKQFYKQDDGYQITVTTVATPPTATSVYLGSVNLTGFGVVSGSTIDMSGRSSSLIRERRVKIKTPLANLSDATVTYGFNQELTVDDHIKAVGSGVITPQNPHGITLGDIGVDVETVVANHQKFMHNNGMIGDPSSILSSLYLEFHQITPGDDFVIIKKLLATEVVNIDGITITSSDLPNDATFLFSSVGDAAGTYYIYLDKFTKSLILTTIDPSLDVTKYPVASMVWTPGITPLFDGNLTSITDLRVFGTINNDKIDNEDTYEVDGLGVHDGTNLAPALFWRSDTDTGIYRSGSGVISFTSNGVLSANISGGQVTAVNGTVSSPSYAFLSDADTGIYRGGDGVLSFTSNGVLSANISGGQVTAVNGTVSSPAYSFLSDINTGMYRGGAGVISFTSSGVLSANISGGQISAVNGSLGAPSYAFLSDSDTGLFLPSSNQLRIVAGATSVATATTTNLQSHLQLQVIDGSYTLGNATPAVYFASNNKTGIYGFGIGASGLGISANNFIAAEFTSSEQNFSSANVATNRFNSQGHMTNADGTAGSPSRFFANESNMGMFRAGSGVLAFSTLGNERLRMSGTSVQPSVPIYITDGTLANPSIAFANDTNTGISRGAFSINSFDLNWNGIQRMSLETLGVYLHSDIFGSTDNSRKCGTATNRWSELHATNVFMGDLHFDNGWILTEGDKVGLDKDQVVLVSSNGKKYRFVVEEIV